MAYALFSDNDKISRTFPTREDVWAHAEEAGLVIDEVTDDTSPAKRVLDQGYTIQRCPPDDAPDRAA